MKDGIAEVRPLHGCESMDSYLVNPDTPLQALILHKEVFMHTLTLLGSLQLCDKYYIQTYRNVADSFWLCIFKSSFSMYFLFVLFGFGGFVVFFFFYCCCFVGFFSIRNSYRLRKTAHRIVAQRKGRIVFPLFFLIQQKIVDTALWNLSSHLFFNI